MINHEDHCAYNEKGERVFQQDHTIPILEIRKKKRRFIYYGLCGLATFVLVRVVILIYFIASTTVNNLKINSITWSSKDPTKIGLNFSYPYIYSPLNLDINDLDVTVECSIEGMKSFKVCDIHIPRIELNKYDNFAYSGEIRIKNISFERLIDVYKSFQRKKLEFFCKCNIFVWFRFCLVKMNWCHFLNQRVVFDKVEKVEGEKESPPIKFKSVEFKEEKDVFLIKLGIDKSEIKVEQFLDLEFSDIHLLITGDLPCTLVISNQKVKDQFIHYPFDIKIVVDKKNLHEFKDTVFKLVKGRNVEFCFDSFFFENYEGNGLDAKKDSKTSVSDDNRVTGSKFYVSYKTFLRQLRDYGDETPKKNIETDVKIEFPILAVKDLRFKDDIVTLEIDIIKSMIHSFLKDVNVSFDMSPFSFDVFMGQLKVTTFTCELLNSKDEIKFLTTFRIDNLEDFINMFNSKEAVFIIQPDIGSSDIFKGYSLIVSREKLEVKYGKNELYLHSFSKKDTPPPDINLRHSIQSDNDSVLIKSILLTDKQSNDYSSNFIFIRMPHLDINISSDFFEGTCTLKTTSIFYNFKSGIFGKINVETLLKINDKYLKENLFKDFDLIKSMEMQITEKLYFRLNNVISGSKSVDSGKEENEEPSRLTLDFVTPKSLSSYSVIVSMEDLPCDGLRIVTNEIVLFEKSNEDLCLSLVSLTESTEAFKNVKVKNLSPEIVVTKKKVFFNLTQPVTVEFNVNSLKILKALVEKNFRFASNQCVLSNIVAQYLNHIIFDSKKEKIINGVDKNFEVFLNVDKDFEGYYDHEIEFSLGIPKDVYSSLKFDITNLPNLSLVLSDDEKKMKYFELNVMDSKISRFPKSTVTGISHSHRIRKLVKLANFDTNDTNFYKYIYVNIKLKNDLLDVQKYNMMYVFHENHNQKNYEGKSDEDYQWIHSNLDITDLHNFVRLFFKRNFEVEKKSDHNKPKNMFLSFAHEGFLKRKIENNECVFIKAQAVFHADFLSNLLAYDISNVMAALGFKRIPNSIHLKGDVKNFKLITFFSVVDNPNASQTSSKEMFPIHIRDAKVDCIYDVVHHPNPNNPAFAGVTNRNVHLNKFLQKYNLPYTIIIDGNVTMMIDDEDILIFTGIKVNLPFVSWLVDLIKEPAPSVDLWMFSCFETSFSLLLPFSLHGFPVDSLRAKICDQTGYTFFDLSLLPEQPEPNIFKIKLAKSLLHKFLILVYKLFSRRDHLELVLKDQYNNTIHKVPVFLSTSKKDGFKETKDFVASYLIGKIIKHCSSFNNFIFRIYSWLFNKQEQGAAVSK